ncbi:hypothetical protein ACL07V_37170 [Streptomyces sp. MB22_4]|uniref:hypothetical protein n=1 Tax=Streptomyces sp. MB22_4 TaxID=3383120 RepID=UPI0039A0B9AB
MASAIEAPASTTAEGQTSHTQNQAAGLLKLRAPFPKDQIQALPKILCRNCSNDRNKVCGEHRKQKCKECDNYITTAHLHLDYVGHAELTNRLLEADLLWDWEPLALDERGLPRFDADGGLWIRLTVCGHSRLGYGDSQGKKGPNAVKEAIGDALRNAAMRFGAALDLWAKSDLKAAQAEHPKSEEDDARASGPSQERPTPAASPAESGGERKESREQAFSRLKEQYRNCWGLPLPLVQIRLEGKKLGFSEERVQGPPPDSEWTTFDKLLADRIAELEAQERSAA